MAIFTLIYSDKKPSVVTNVHYAYECHQMLHMMGVCKTFYVVKFQHRSMIITVTFSKRNNEKVL